MTISRIQAMQLYEDYHCNGNTKQTSVEQMAEIVRVYQDEIPQWQKKIMEHDQVEYDFDDDEFKNFVEKGKQDAKNTTGYKDNALDKVDQYGHVITDSAVSVGGAAAAAVANGGIGIKAMGMNLKVGEKTAEKAATVLGQKVLEKGGEKLAEKITTIGAKKLVKEGLKEMGVKATKEAVKEGAKIVMEKGAAEITKEGVKEVAKEGAKEGAKIIEKTAAKEAGTQAAGQSISCIVGCVMGAASAAAYWIKNPNKDQVEAANEVNKIHQDNMSELAASQSDMENMSVEIQAAAEEAEQINEEANNLIRERKTEYDRYNKTRAAIKTKADSGKAISGSDKSLYSTVSKSMIDAGEEINSTVDETSEAVAGIQDDMSSFQKGFDDAAETMGTTQGATEYAAGFDTSTEILCYVEGGAQGLNATSSAIAGARAAALAASGSWAFGATAWAWAFAVMGFAAAGSSGIAAGQQFTWGNQVHNEIETRDVIEKANVATLNEYNVEVDNYDYALSDVEGLEIDMPDEISAPDDTELKTAGEMTEPEDKFVKKSNVK